jgi:hypothetical protein
MFIEHIHYDARDLRRWSARELITVRVDIVSPVFSVRFAEWFSVAIYGFVGYTYVIPWYANHALHKNLAPIDRVDENDDHVAGDVRSRPPLNEKPIPDEQCIFHSPRRV